MFSSSLGFYDLKKFFNYFHVECKNIQRKSEEILSLINQVNITASIRNNRFYFKDKQIETQNKNSNNTQCYTESHAIQRMFLCQKILFIKRSIY